MGWASTNSARCSRGSSQAGSYAKLVPPAPISKVYCHGMCPALTPRTAEQARWPKHPINSSSRGTRLPSSTGSLCHRSLTKVPHLQHAREGWRRRAVTVAPVMTKSVAQGDATAPRLSSGPAVSCVRRADMAQTAEVRLLLPVGWQQCRGFVRRWLRHMVLLEEGVGAGLTSLQLTAQCCHVCVSPSNARVSLLGPGTSLRGLAAG